MYTLHYPGNTHHNEQLSEQELEKYFHLFLLCCHEHPVFSTNISWTHKIQIYQVQEIFTHHINPDQNSCYNKLGCASVKLLVWLEFFKVLKGLINFGWWMTMLGMLGDHLGDGG